VLSLKKVENKKDLNRFIKFPYQLYRSDPNWVPPLISDQREMLERRHPFWRHARAEFYLVERDGEVVGRIASIIDDNYISFHNEKTGYFGFYEAVDDDEVARILIEAAVGYLKKEGMVEMIGPMNPSTNEECGFLVEGYDSPPVIMMTYNPPYYHRQMERSGLEKASDLLAFLFRIEDAPVDRLRRFKERIVEKYPDLTVRPVDLKHLDRDVMKIKEVYNDAWQRNWGFVPMTELEFEHMKKKLKPLCVPELVPIIEIGGEPAAVALSLPDYNRVLKHLNGRLDLIGIIKFLWYRRKINFGRMLIMGVKHKYRRMGLEAILFYESIMAGKKLGYWGGELSWILEDNLVTKNTIEKVGGRVYKRYRIYRCKV